MRVFISGVAGFLGSHLADAFLARGDAVVGCDNLLGGERDNVPTDVEYHDADCADVAAMRRLTDGCELVYHCAAVAAEGLSVFSPALVSYHTYQTTAGLLSGAVAAGARRFVFCSSMARYGAGPVPFHEEQPAAPVDPYGIAKYAGELLVANVCRTHGVEHVIAVPHNIIGPRQRYDDPYRNVAGIFINLMLQGRQPVIYGDGQQKRCFSFVSDCVDPLVALGCLPSVDGEIFNVGPDEEFITVLALAQGIAELLECDLEPAFVPERPGEVRLATCAADKARTRLGYRTCVALRDGLAQMIDWIRAKGPRPFRYHLPIEIESPLAPRTWTERTL